VSDELISAAAAARWLGISAGTLKAWSERGHVPSLTLPNGRRRYSTADLDAFIASARRQAGASSAEDDL
jgi:predicted site-specific integrase-resolvase